MKEKKENAEATATEEQVYDYKVKNVLVLDRLKKSSSASRAWMFMMALGHHIFDLTKAMDFISKLTQRSVEHPDQDERYFNYIVAATTIGKLINVPIDLGNLSLVRHCFNAQNKLNDDASLEGLRLEFDVVQRLDKDGNPVVDEFDREQKDVENIKLFVYEPVEEAVEA